MFFYNFQFGFREGYSTTLSLLEFIDKIRENLDNGEYTLSFFIDFTKAFDTVDHSILLYKLEHYGIRGHTNKFFKSYLSDRKQFTVINGISSKPENVSCGVPQGSVLGPLFFILYINDIYESVSPDSIRLFADDTSLTQSDKNLNKLCVTAKQQFKKLLDWCNCNKLSINAEKN